MRIGLILVLGIMSIYSMTYPMYIYNNSNIDEETSSALKENEIMTFNSKFNKYQGAQNSSTVYALIDVFKANYYTSDSDEDKMPVIVFVSESGEQSELCEDKESIETIKEKIEKNKKYYVYMMENSKTNLIHGIVISNIKDEKYLELAEEIANK